MKYKKYILFQYFDYYPNGGLHDIEASFDTIEEARNYVSTRNVDGTPDNNEIVDRDTWELIPVEQAQDVFVGDSDHDKSQIV